MATATTRLRREIAALSATAGDDLGILWRGAQTPAELEAALRDLLPSLVTTYGLAAASVAADWYDGLRAESDVRGRFSAIVPDVGDAGSQSLIGWALTESQDLPGFQTLILGGTQRRIWNASRLTVTGSSVADPGARGWYRVGDGHSCEFCSMLLGRGAVYTEATADFPAHDHCGCTAAPEWA